MEREPSAGSATETADQRQDELSWLRSILVWAGLAALVAAGCGAPAGSPPPPFDPVERTIPELQQAMADGRVTSRVLVEQYLARIEAYDQRGPRLNAMISINAAVRDEADALDRERAATGPRSPLHGIPVVVKDNYDVVGMPTTAGSIALADWYPPDDSFQVARLKEAGAVILGKANMHEFAYGLTTVSSRGGQTRNPYDPSRNPGGSSGGTGAAVAANYAAAGMGTDTCGSIRIPSFHHALVGLRGTRGLSSRAGIVPLALTQDMGGPLTKTVTDMALMLDATVGVDASDDVTSRSEGRIPASYTQQLSDATLDGARIGVVEWLLGDAPEDQPVAEVIRAALNEIETAGGQIVEVELAGVPELLDGASLISTEFPRQLADYLAAPGTPVRTLAEVLERGLYHAAVEDRYTRSLDAGGYDDPTYQEALGQRSRFLARSAACCASGGSTRLPTRPCDARRRTSAIPNAGTTAPSAPGPVFPRWSCRPATLTTGCRSVSSCSGQSGARPSCWGWPMPTSSGRGIDVRRRRRRRSRPRGPWPSSGSPPRPGCG